LWHFTTHLLLSRHLHGVGLNTQHVPAIGYDVTVGGKAGSTSISVPTPALPALTLAGTITEPSQPISFVGNWWATADGGLLKMNSTVPEARVGEAQLMLTTRADSPLGQLIGGTTMGFAALQRFNTFVQAHTEVSLYKRQSH
ncbi:MAG: hypothetical protein M3Q45_13680, partial [Chloroflexota bacterium]|nr:hypothetical protein [Chloroflexota bacterium]